MSKQLVIQLVALVVMVASLTASAGLLPGILQKSDENVLRYTNVSVEGAPPIVVVGTAIGALRGLIVDYLWVKANAMKEAGLYYEAMSDADLITKLQPRFAQVWGFHGHNMAYNISVATHTVEERWEWVNNGINLVRNQGLRYNPNDIALHRELAFWFDHKVEGVSDDAHLYYKRMFCEEWNTVLGPPPEDYQDRIAWIKRIADAPGSLGEAELRTPGVKDLVEHLQTAIGSATYKPKLDRNFLFQYSQWQAVKQFSNAAKILNKEQEYRQRYPNTFPAFDKLATDPALQQQWTTLIELVRKRVLLDEYNMDPQLMYEYTRDTGPIDWRHPSAHALYWSRRGDQFGSGRLSDEDIYIALNNDSQQLQAMQNLARSGRITFDPFSTEMPGRFPEPRWIDTINNSFEYYYGKHYEVRGAGGERFINFLTNFLSSSICEWYRAGETQRAKALLERLDKLFGGTGPVARGKFKEGLKDLDAFVYNETLNQYQAQPHVAPRDVAASLRYGLRVSILANRPDVLQASLTFVQKVTDFFKNNDWFDYINVFGEGRMADILGSLDDSMEIAYWQTMTDSTLSLRERIAIWNGTDKIETEVTRRPPTLRALVYDRVLPSLQQQFAQSELSTTQTLDQAFPAPPNLEVQRQVLLKRQQERAAQMEEIRKRDPLSRQGM